MKSRNALTRITVLVGLFTFAVITTVHAQVTYYLTPQNPTVGTYSPISDAFINGRNSEQIVFLTPAAGGYTIGSMSLIMESGATPGSPFSFTIELRDAPTARQPLLQEPVYTPLMS